MKGKNISALTSLRLERAKLQSELDKLNDYVRETRQTRNPFQRDSRERIKSIEKRNKDINTQLKKDLKKPQKMFTRTSPLSRSRSQDDLLSGITNGNTGCDCTNRFK